MERVVRVNAFRGSSAAAETRGELNSAADQRSSLEWEPADSNVRFDAETGRDDQADLRNRGDQGPCLYLGPAGQRCRARALTGGFCARHRSNTNQREPAVAVSPRKLIAILAAAIALWPILADVVRAILRYIH
jgi:hypothetical protein